MDYILAIILSVLDYWCAMPKMTQIKSELISNINMHLFLEKGMRVGISCITKRYSKKIINACNHMILMKKVNLLCI